MSIRNCQFKFKCTQTWDSLIETADPSIKYCHECDRGVHYCFDESDLMHALENDWCVAIHVTDENDKNIIRELVGDLAKPVSTKE